MREIKINQNLEEASSPIEEGLDERYHRNQSDKNMGQVYVREENKQNIHHYRYQRSNL